MDVGDPCFAHVRSYPWWPAKVISKSQQKNVYHVKFFGTGETARLPLKELAPISPKNISKYCNSKILKRKYYKEGVEQMKAEYPWIVIPDPVVSLSSILNTVKKFKTKEADSAKQFSPKDPTERVAGVTPLAEININTGEVEKSSDGIDNVEKAKCDDSFEWGEYEPLFVAGKVMKKRHYFASRVSKSYICDDCGESFSLAESKDMHMLVAHRDNPEIVGGDSKGSEAVAVKTKSKKKCKPALPKLVKTLREDEADGNKAFADKIEVKDNCFYCKSCSEFSTVSKLKARCHALSCGKKKPKTRTRKLSPCLLCEEIFKNKKLLYLHNKTHHYSKSYTCSTCGKKFTMRQNYKRHLATHEEKVELVCPVARCSKTFSTKSNLTRHLKKMHKQQNKEPGEGLPNASIELSPCVGQQLGHGVLGVQDHPETAPHILQLSSFEQFQSGTDIVINCNFVGEAIGFEGGDDNNNEENYNDKIVMEEEHESFAFIADIVSELVNCVISAKMLFPTSETGLPTTTMFSTTMFPTTVFPTTYSYDFNSMDEISQMWDVQPTPENTECPPNTFAIQTVNQDGIILQSPYQFQEFPLTSFTNSSTVVSLPLSSGSSGLLSNSISSVCSSITNVTEEAPDTIAISSQNYNNEDNNAMMSEDVKRRECNSNREVKAKSEGKVRREGKASRNGYKCRYCGIDGILGPSKLKLHIDRMHLSPVVCKICGVTFEDKYWFVEHYPKCFYFCTKPECNFHDKRKERYLGHMKRHEND